MKPSVGLFAPLAFVLFLTFGGFLARWTQPFEIFSHFRLHLATAGVALMFAFAMFGRMRAAACAAVAALANVVAVGYALAAPAPATTPAAQTTRVLWANLLRKQDALEAVAALAAAEHADIVALTELPPGRVDAVRRALPGFQCIIADASSTSAGAVLIASRRPCSAGGAAPTTVRPATAQFADVGRMRFAALHARPPWSNERTAQRNAVISAGVAITRAHAYGVLAGDFNATPWSPVMIDASRALRRAPCGAPWTATWGGNFPFHRLAIDHILVTRSVVVARCRVGPDIGSDHRPLIADVAAAPAG